MHLNKSIAKKKRENHELSVERGEKLHGRTGDARRRPVPMKDVVHDETRRGGVCIR
jgi:hypothetical protein